MVNPDNKIDKNRFEKMRDGQTNRGRDQDGATQIAAGEAKEFRRARGGPKTSLRTALSEATVLLPQ